MNDHPLGDTTGIATTPSPVVDQPSIVDSIFDLDNLMSADVRRAEKSARFSVRPDLEAEIEDLDAELATLTDSQGRPLASDADLSIAEGAGRSAHVVNSELIAKQAEYAASMKTVRMRALSDDEWTAFQTKYRQALDDQPPYPPAFYEDLIVASAIAPKFTAEGVRAFRAKMGAPAFEVLFRAAWAVNTQSGVSIPKSSLSSVVQRQSQRG